MNAVLSPVVVVAANLIVWLPAVAAKLLVVYVAKVPEAGVKVPIAALSNRTLNDWTPPKLARCAALKLNLYVPAASVRLWLNSPDTPPSVFK